MSSNSVQKTEDSRRKTIKTQDRVSSMPCDTRHLCNNIIGDADPEPKTGTAFQVGDLPGPLKFSITSCFAV